MSGEPKGRVEATAGKNWLLSLDTWAVIFALLAALLVRVGVIKHISW